MNAPRAARSAWLLPLFGLFLPHDLAAAGPEPHALPAARIAADDGAWTGPLAGAAPPSRYAQSAIYDPVRDRMLMFGGLGDGGQLRNDVWALSLAGNPTWTEVIPTGHAPTPRFHHTTVYDPVRDRLLVFGGWDTTGPENDVWALSLSGNPSWDRLNAGQGPERRYQHTAIYDPVRDRMIVSGGSVNGYYEEDAWALELAGNLAWRQLPYAPTDHWLHTAIYDPVRDRMVVFGGYSEGDASNETWELSFAGGESWSQLTPMPDPMAEAPPFARFGHAAVYDPARDQMLVFGGQWHNLGDPYLNDVWTLALGENLAWRQLAPGGGAPVARYVCAAIVRDDRMLVFGGENFGVVRNDTWTLSLAQPVSTPRETDLPRRFDLARPRPNPSRGETVLGFDVAQPARVVLDVFDSQGRRVGRVADAWFPAGRHAVRWRGEDERGHVVGSGVYYVQMQAGAFRAIRRTVRLR